MTTRISPSKFLSFWEDSWGKLSPEWSENFLSDIRIDKILIYPGLVILSAVQKHRKLDEILSFLEANSNPIRVTDKSGGVVLERPVSNRQQNKPTFSDVKEIFAWLTRMKDSKFDPENTFPRLIVKSTREICEGKRKYKSEKDAILALINLEEIKGELVKQLPYKCNICREFHNTHLISRETFEKLLRKCNPAGGNH
jgi:hypothetical protein